MQFTYDRWGNVSATSTLPLSIPFPGALTSYSSNTNRLIARPNGDPLPTDAYDAAGNLQDHPDIGQMTYDAENRLVGYSFKAA